MWSSRGGQLVDRDLHLAQVERHAGDLQFALGELVLVIELAQVEVVVGGRHPRRILVPVEQVERERLLAEQVVVDDVGPDQVARPHHVEDVGHARAVEVAALGHHLLERCELRVVDEDEQVAGLGEIDLGRQERRRLEQVSPRAAR